jgi:hypothetical protein
MNFINSFITNPTSMLLADPSAEGSYGKWAFRVVKATTEVNGVISGLAQPAEAVGA